MNSASDLPNSSARAKKIDTKEMLFLACLILFGVVFVFCWLATYGNGLQTYTDVVYEYTSTMNSNKSAERTLAYVLALIGVCIVFAFYSIRNGRQEFCAASEESQDDRAKQKSDFYACATILVVAAAALLLIYGTTNTVLTAMLLLLILLAFVKREYAVDGLVFFVFCLYAVSGLYRLYVWIGGTKDIGVKLIVFVSFAAAVLILLFSKICCKNFFVKSALLIQICIPFSLLVFFAAKYQYQGEIIVLELPRRVTWSVAIVIVWFIILACLEIKKNWKKTSVLENAVSFGTLCSIMLFNNYGGSGQIISSDFHHPFENIIAFSQIIELGQKPFSEYIPVSGMYSLVQGFFLHLFGSDYYAYYNVTENLFFLAVILAVIWLLRRQFRNYGILLITMLVPVVFYNRMALIIPVMLLLSWPKLIQNKNLWLKAWMLSSLVHGLYYPVFGAAVCLGFLPLGICQIAAYSKGDLKSDIKHARFWAGWTACIIPVILCVPLLLGTLKHMMAMGGQTVYADGLARFGQIVQKSFFSSYPQGFRLLAYYCFTFLIPVSVIWVSVVMAMKIGHISIKEKKLSTRDTTAAALYASIGISLLIAFSYTMIRLDIDTIYTRSICVIYSAVVLLLLLCARYVKASKTRYALIGFAIFLIGAVSGEAFFSIDSASKLDPYYRVPEEYVLKTDSPLTKLGKCFVPKSKTDLLDWYYYSAQSLDLDAGYLGIGPFGRFYFSDIKGDSAMESTSIRGFSAVEETVDLIRKNKTIVSVTDPFANYYLYHWLLTSGEYIWSAEDGYFYPNTQNTPKETVREYNKACTIPYGMQNLGKTPTSWGSSMQSLEGIFSSPDIEANWTKTADHSLNVEYEETVNGDDADFIYLEFENVDDNFQYILFNLSEEEVQTDPSWIETKLMKRDYNHGTEITLSWTDEENDPHSLSFALGRGKLLIPMGCGRDWLLHDHEGITITASTEGDTAEVPELSVFRLLKVREVN